MLNSHSIAKFDKQRLLELHKPDLEKVLCYGITPTKLQGLVHPGNLIRNRLSLDEYRPQFSILCQAGQGTLVNISILVPESGEQVRDDGRLNFSENLVWSHLDLIYPLSTVPGQDGLPSLESEIVRER